MLHKIMMNNWIKVDFPDEKLNQNYANEGDNMQLFVSPYNAPEAVRSYLNANKLYVIEIKYLADERCRSVTLNENVKADIGVNSERLYKLETEYDPSFDVVKVREHMMKALQLLISGEDEILSRSGNLLRDNVENYKYVFMAIEKVSDRLNFKSVEWQPEYAYA